MWRKLDTRRLSKKCWNIIWLNLHSYKKSPKHSLPICTCIPQIMIKTHAQWGLAWTPQSCLGISGCRLYNCTRSTIPIQLYVRHLTNAPNDKHLTYRIEHKSLLYNSTVDTQYPQSSLYHQSVQEARQGTQSQDVLRLPTQSCLSLVCPPPSRTCDTVTAWRQPPLGWVTQQLVTSQVPLTLSWWYW